MLGFGDKGVPILRAAGFAGVMVISVGSEFPSNTLLGVVLARCAFLLLVGTSDYRARSGAAESTLRSAGSFVQARCPQYVGPFMPLAGLASIPRVVTYNDIGFSECAARIEPRCQSQGR